MPDTLDLLVLRVWDGATFEGRLLVEPWTKPGGYARVVRIRIANLPAWGLPRAGARREDLAARLEGRRVRCAVLARTPAGVLICEVAPAD